MASKSIPEIPITHRDFDFIPITHRDFVYVPASKTDIRKTFERVRREMASRRALAGVSDPFETKQGEQNGRKDC